MPFGGNITTIPAAILWRGSEAALTPVQKYSTQKRVTTMLLKTFHAKRSLIVIGCAIALPLSILTADFVTDSGQWLVMGQNLANTRNQTATNLTAGNVAGLSMDWTVQRAQRYSAFRVGGPLSMDHR
jgi:hypothetical protein